MHDASTHRLLDRSLLRPNRLLQILAIREVSEARHRLSLELQRPADRRAYAMMRCSCTKTLISAVRNDSFVRTSTMKSRQSAFARGRQQWDRSVATHSFNAFSRQRPPERVPSQWWQPSRGALRKALPQLTRNDQPRAGEHTAHGHAASASTELDARRCEQRS